MAEVRIPKYGMSTIEVDVTEILVSVGQHISIGDPIAEVETEKTTAVLESNVAGTVTEILVDAGQSCEVGDVVCRVE